MPSKYVLRTFAAGEIYHIYNRGVNKTEIFFDNEDYKTFLYYLFIYTAPLPEVITRYPKLNIKIQRKNLAEEIEMLAYCLMPNHFHLLIKQNSKDGITKLMKQLSNAYTKYFNIKYERVGHLFQGRYKSVHVTRDEELTHISRYIHLNPFIAGITTTVRNDKWTSFGNYLRPKDKGLIHPELVLSFFKNPKNYEVFVLNHLDYARRLNRIKHILLE